MLAHPKGHPVCGAVLPSTPQPPPAAPGFLGFRAWVYGFEGFGVFAFLGFQGVVVFCVGFSRFLRVFNVCLGLQVLGFGFRALGFRAYRVLGYEATSTANDETLATLSPHCTFQSLYINPGTIPYTTYMCVLLVVYIYVFIYPVMLHPV